MDSELLAQAEIDELEYDDAFLAKIEARMADGATPVPHAEAMARIDATIARAKQRR